MAALAGHLHILEAEMFEATTILPISISRPARVLPDGIRYCLLHTDLRDEQDHWVDRPRHGAGVIQFLDPAAERLLGPEQRALARR